MSAVFFLLAAFAVLDALQTLMRHEFNRIDLIAGETVLVSGMLPAQAGSHADMDVYLEGDPIIRFDPQETYKGFWMGGRMWRASLSAYPFAHPGTAGFTITDLTPEGQQNPALIFTVTVWPSAEALQKADNSLCRRYTGFPPFGAAVAVMLVALVFGAANALVFSSAERILALHGVFVLHGIAKFSDGSKPGYKAAFARVGQDFMEDEPVFLLDTAWRMHGTGRMIEINKFKGFAFFPQTGERPRYGWLAVRATSI